MTTDSQSRPADSDSGFTPVSDAGPDEAVAGPALAETHQEPEPQAASGAATASRPAPGIAAYWAERRHYLQNIRKVPELRQKFVQALAIYILRRALWSFGFFPVFIAFWVPFVLASFNPVVLVGELLPALEAFLNANPEVQANTISTLVIAWLSIGFFFLVFDFVLTPFRSPYQYEADVYMRAWELRNHDQLPDKV
ncbi:MAG: hypothetical protein R3280_02025 [Marinobacter sp.]|uniref:hypothetical protein n=1 Tax=Marinobacter sp. TaxID=50741 RepID=UPI00299D416D|nr:hypothetical protein [Marinobacter sp.]MDX1633391.1 hypothetical protein [Marinobacter sp.]